MRTSFHHQPEAQHPHSPAINTPAGRLPHLWVISGQTIPDQNPNFSVVTPIADKRAPINCAGPEVSGQSVQFRNVDLASEACRIDAMRRTAKMGHEEISPSFRVGGQVVYLDRG